MQKEYILNPKVNEPIRNLGGNAYVFKVISDTEVIVRYFGILQQVTLIGRTSNQIRWPHGELCVG